MHAVLNAALPIFALILSGYLCARFKILGEAAADSLNSFTVYLALPALLFLAMTRVTAEQFAQVGFAYAFGCGIAATYLAGFIAGLARTGAVSRASMDGINASYANVGYMGIPLCLLLFGQEAAAPAIIGTLFTATVLFAFTIIMIEGSLNGKSSPLRVALKVLGSVARNPLVIAPAAGIAVGLSGLTIPSPIGQYLQLMSGAASPCALVCIGLTLAHTRGEGATTSVSFLVFLKLLFHPAITAVFVIFVFDMPPVWASVAILLSALPTGSGPYIIAKLYDVEATSTARAILVSHVLSVGTVSLLVAYFGSPR